MEKSKENYWPYIIITLLIATILVILFFSVNNIDSLEKKNAALMHDVKLTEKVRDSFASIHKSDSIKLDSLANITSVKNEEKIDNNLKTKADEKFNKVNTFSVSEQQLFFDSVANDYIKRKGKSINSRQFKR